MKPVQGDFLIKLDDLYQPPFNMVKIPNADYLERTGSENLVRAALAIAAALSPVGLRLLTRQ